MSELTRFSVAPLSQTTRKLAAVASGRADPDLVITGAGALYEKMDFEQVACSTPSASSSAPSPPRWVT